MQVSYANDHVTHAVIGGGQTIDFGISNSAEFFNILSSTLYKDQILAVVRESLCNAWDAHIEAGCTDIPVIVTVADNKLTIKDSGLGIHHDDMGLIYGTYGNSTKKNDGSQTGGFGLGCKSPFAYTDHFEVISSHAGVRTIYALAKSSAEVGGKPGIKTIAQFPTTETGLTVTINLKPADSVRFRTLIRRIAANGDMNVHLNGEQIHGIDFDTAKSNWMINTAKVSDSDFTPVTIRYGNVIYPVDGSHKDIAKEYSAIEAYVKKLQHASYSFQSEHQQIIFQAPAHSIAVTPSRESLSMQDHTVRTLKKLFDGFLSEMGTALESENLKVADTSITEAVTNKDIKALLSVEPQLPIPAKDRLEKDFKVSTVAEYAKRYLSIHYPQEVTFRKQDITNRISKMVNANLVDRGRAKTFLQELEGVDHFQTTRYYRRNEWFSRRIVGKLLTKLTAAGLEPNSLWVRDTNDYSLRHTYGGGDGLVKATKACPQDLYASLPFLRPIVVLTSAKTDLTSRLNDLNGGPLDGKYHGLNGYLVYVFGRKKGDKEAAQAFFSKTDMTVIDMTELEEVEAKIKPAIPVVSKPRPKGLPMLKEILGSSDNYTYTSRIKDHSDTVARVLDPLFIVAISTGTNSSLSGFNETATRALVKIFGDVVGVANSAAQEKTWTKKFPEGRDYLIPHVCEYVKNSPAIKEYFTKCPSKIQDYRHSMKGDVDYSFIPMVTKSKLLRKRFDLEDPRTEEEVAYTDLFLYIVSSWGFGSNDILRTECSAIIDVPINPTVKALLDKAAGSHLIKALEIHKIDSLMSNPKMVEKVLKMFFYALNN